MLICISLCVMLLDLHSCVWGTEISQAWLKWHAMGPPFTPFLCSRIGHVVWACLCGGWTAVAHWTLTHNTALPPRGQTTSRNP